MPARTKEALQNRFVCAKCHSHSCVAEDVTLASGPLSRMLPVGATRFIALSCSLCGYTEFFNLAVIAHEEEPALGKAELREGMEKA